MPVRQQLVWWATSLAGLAAAVAMAIVVAGQWLDPRFSMIVDDGLHHLLRQYVFDHLLRQGAVYPRWWPDLAYGYGYPLLNYYSPGLYYAGAVAWLFGAGVYRAVQWVGFGGVLLGATGAYLLGWLLFRQRLAGVLVAGAYVLAPYPFVTNLYLRAAIPEAVGQGLLPWVLAGALVTVRRHTWAAPLALALPLATMVVFHTLSGIISTGLLAAWLPAAVLDEPCHRRRAGLRALAGLTLGLALPAFVWLPAAVERGAVHAELGNIGNLTPTRWLFDPLRPTENPVESAVPEPYLLTIGAPIDLHWVYPHAGTGLSGPAKPSLAQAVFLAAALLAAASGWLSLRFGAMRFGAAPLPGEGLQRWHRRVEATVPGVAGVRFPLPLGAGKGEGSPSTRLARAPHSRRRPRLVMLVVAAALPVLWLLNVSWSAAVWTTVPVLPVLQFPWRLWGPFALFLACAGASLFAWLDRRGQQQWVLAAGLLVFMAINGLAGLRLAGRVARRPMVAEMPGWAQVLRTNESDRLGSGTTTGGEFMPRSVDLGDPPDLSHQGRAAYEATFPEGGWIAGKVWPYRGAVAVAQVWATTTWTEARVTAAPGPDDQPPELAFHTLVFPGWRAFVDGRPAQVRPAPFDDRVRLGPGFAIVPLPPGEHTVRLALGPTLSRTLAGEITILAGGVALALAAAATLGRPLPANGRPPAAPAAGAPTVRRRRSPAPHPAIIAVLAVTVASGLVYAAAGWRAATHPTGRATPQRALVALDVVAAVAQGSASIASPAGAALGQFVDVRHEALGGQDRRWLYMHPPSLVQVDLTMPPQAIFQAGLGIDRQGWDDPSADGVRFILEASDPATGATETLLDQVLQPQVNAADRGWRFAQVDLGRFAGRRITLRLRTDGRDTPYFDWAGWADAAVYVDTSARYPPPPSVARAMLPRLP